MLANVNGCIPLTPDLTFYNLDLLTDFDVIFDETSLYDG